MDFNTLQFLLSQELITLSLMDKGRWLWSSLGPTLWVPQCTQPSPDSLHGVSFSCDESPDY